MKRIFTLAIVAILGLWVFTPKLNAQCGPAQSSVTFTLDMTNDSYPSENGWKLVLTQSGTPLDSACFSSYSGGVQSITACLDTGLTYSLYAYDSWGDGIDGAEYRIAYTYGPGIDTIGSVEFDLIENLCASAGELEDSTSFYVSYFPAPSCLTPNTLSNSTPSSTTVDLDWVDPNTATEWEIEYGASGFPQGSGTVVHVTSAPPYNLSGLSAGTAYDWYVRSICGVGDTSSWTTVSSFTTCPTGAICASYTAGDIASDRDFNTVADFPSTCPDTLSVTIPAGNRIDSISTSYDMTAGNGGWMSEQVSLLHCPNTSTGEAAVSTGSGSSAGTLSYNRTGLTFASGATGNVDIVMHAGRTFGGSACDPSYNKVDNGTWQIIAYYSVIPPCIEPTALNWSNNSAAIGTSVDLSWTENNSATEWQIQYDTAGFTVGTGNIVTTTTNPHTINGLTASTSYEWYVRSICAPTDTSNWSLMGSFVTPCQAAVAPYTEDFETNMSSIPTCWEQGASNSENWRFATSGGHVGNVGTIAGNSASDGYFAYVDDSSPHNTATELYTPFVDVSALTQPRLTFYTISDNEGDSNVDFHVDVWDGAQWNDSLFFADTNSLNAAWEKITLDLSSLTITGAIQVRFVIDEVNGTDFDDDRAIDDVVIEETPSCIVPTALVSANISATSADLSWTDLNAASEWEIEYGVTGFTQGTGTTVSVTTTASTTLSGLSSATNYDWYVRAVCAVGDTSNWSTSGNFVTPCTKDTLTFTDDFNSGSFSPCWTISDATDVTIEATCGTRSNVIEINYTEEAITPVIKAAAAQNVEVGYYMAAGACTNDPEDSEHFYVEYWDGTQWVLAKDYDGTWPQAFVWDSFIVPPSALTDSFMVKFNMIDGTTDAWQIDSVVIKEGPSCIPATNLSSTNVSGTSADLAWIQSSAPEFQVQYDTAGFTIGTGVDSLTTDTFINLSGLQPQTDYEWYVRAICSPGDTSSWSSMGVFTTLCAPVTAPWVERFPTNSLPNCWIESGNTTWEYGSQNGTTPSGFAAYGASNVADNSPGGNGTFIGMDGSDNSGSDSSDLTTPEIDVSTLNAPRLEFYIFSNNTNDGALNKTIVEFYDGANWHDVDSIQANLGPNWDHRIINLSSFTITGPVKARFTITPTTTGGSAFYNDILLDDIGFLETPTCPDPTALSYTPTSTTSADVSWTSTASAPNAILEYGVAGFSLGSGNRIVSSSTTESITGLSPNLAYEAYVKDSCAVGDTSAWIGPLTFGGDVVPCDDFDAYNAGNAASQSILVNGWGGTVAGGGDAEYSTDYASSGTQSLKIHDSGTNAFSDVVAEVGTYSSGMWNVAIDLYVPSGNGGYYNILHNYTGATNVWAVEITLDSNGTATVEEGTNGTATIGTYNYNVGAWNRVEHIIDLDNDTAYIRVNGVNTNVGWQFSLGSANFGDQFNAMNFFSTAPTGQTPLIYFDNFCITEVLPHYPIGVINTEDASGDADSSNVECSISGTVVGYDRRGGNGYEFALVDLITGVQEGITVFEFNDVSGYTNPTEGDSLLIFGSVDQFRGLTQFRPDSIVVLGSGTVPTPDSASTLDETTESILVQMNNWILLDSSRASGSYNLEARNLSATDTITIRIDSDSDISDSLAVVGNAWVVGDTLCSMIGVGGQFDFNSPFLGDYQVFPSLYTDVTVCKLFTGIKDVSAKSKAISIYPNPTVGQFTVSSNGLKNNNAMVTVRDISGKIVLQDKIANSNSSFTKQYDLSGNAKGLYLISIIDGENRINQKLIVQ